MRGLKSASPSPPQFLRPESRLSIGYVPDALLAFSVCGASCSCEDSVPVATAVEKVSEGEHLFAAAVSFSPILDLRLLRRLPLMLEGASAPPHSSGMTWSTTYPLRPFG